VGKTSRVDSKCYWRS